MEYVIPVLTIIVAVLSLGATVTLFVLGNIRRDHFFLHDEMKKNREEVMQELGNLYRIKSGISGELAAFKQESAKEFVTYTRMTLALENHTSALNQSVARIESELKVLTQVREMLAALSARMDSHRSVGLNQSGSN